MFWIRNIAKREIIQPWFRVKLSVMVGFELVLSSYLKVLARSNGRRVHLTFTLLGGRTVESDLSPDEAKSMALWLRITGADDRLPVQVDAASAKEFGDRLEGLAGFRR